MLDEQIDDGAETLNSGFESEPVVAMGARTPRWTKRWVKSDSGPAGSWLCVGGVAALCTVERVGERLDVRRVPGFEPVRDSTKNHGNPVFVGEIGGLCGSERVRKRLAKRETAGSTAGSGEPSRTSHAGARSQRLRASGEGDPRPERELRATTSIMRSSGAGPPLGQRRPSPARLGGAPHP